MTEEFEFRFVIVTKAEKTEVDVSYPVNTKVKDALDEVIHSDEVQVKTIAKKGFTLYIGMKNSILHGCLLF